MRRPPAFVPIFIVGDGRQEAAVGSLDGFDDGTVLGSEEGSDETLGMAEGEELGSLDGSDETLGMDDMVGPADGSDDTVGLDEGAWLGLLEGTALGTTDGAEDGAKLGLDDGVKLREGFERREREKVSGAVSDRYERFERNIDTCMQKCTKDFAQNALNNLGKNVMYIFI